MISISPARSAKGAESYYLHLKEDGDKSRIEDYYSKEGEGTWCGAAAAHLGLEGRVEAKDFSRLARGFDPDGEPLVRKAGADDRRAGWDVTFSAPKSVSVAWAVGDEQTRAAIQAAHQAAVDKGWRLLEERAAFARVGEHGTGKSNSLEHVDLVAARFEHRTSREQDPQVHEHRFVFNEGLRQDGRWAGLESREFMVWAKTADALYQAELADRLRQMGYQVERASEQSFRLASVNKEAEAHFSQRAAQIEQWRQAHGVTSYAAGRVGVLETRKGKEAVPQTVLDKDWKDRAEAHGITRETLQPGEREAERLELKAPTEILAEATRMEALTTEKELIRQAAIASIGSQGADRALAMAERTKAEAVAMTNGQEIKYTAQDLLDAERALQASAALRATETHQRLAPQTVQQAIQEFEERKGITLSEEQRQAIEHVCSGSGGHAYLVGDAGTGKSTVLEVVKDAYEREGYQVIGCALAGKAAAGLEAGSGIESRTLHSTLAKIENGTLPITDKTIVIVDEYGMVDSRLKAQINSHLDAAGAKLVAAGDPKQLQPVAAGATMKAEIEAAGSAARLTEIYRQKEEWRREAVRQMSQGEAGKALAEYIERGRVTVADSHQKAVDAAVGKYLEARQAVGDDSRVVMCSATNRVVGQLNAQAREHLRDHLGEDHKLKTLSGEGISVAVGDRVLVTRNDRETGLRNGDFATVKAVDKDGNLKLHVDRMGSEIQAKAGELEFRHGYAATTHKLQGATVDRAIVLGSSQTSREMAYVQDSRAREATEWVFTRNQVKELASKTPAAEKQIKYSQDIEARRIAAGLDPQLEKKDSYSQKEIHDYRDQHSPRQHQAKQDKAADPRLEELKEVAKAMAKEKQKETTLDWKRVDGRDDSPARGGDRNQHTQDPLAKARQLEIRDGQLAKAAIESYGKAGVLTPERARECAQLRDSKGREYYVTPTGQVHAKSLVEKRMDHNRAGRFVKTQDNNILKERSIRGGWKKAGALESVVVRAKLTHETAKARAAGIAELKRVAEKGARAEQHHRHAARSSGPTRERDRGDLVRGERSQERERQEIQTKAAEAAKLDKEHKTEARTPEIAYGVADQLHKQAEQERAAGKDEKADALQARSNQYLHEGDELTKQQQQAREARERAREHAAVERSAAHFYRQQANKAEQRNEWEKAQALREKAWEREAKAAQIEREAEKATAEKWRDDKTNDKSSERDHQPDKQGQEREHERDEHGTAQQKQAEPEYEFDR